MRHLVIAVLAAAGLAGSARADWGGAGPPPTPPSAIMPGKPTASPDRYGLLPCLRKHFKCGCSKWANGGVPEDFGANQGTLVFPNHPFVRSPRDFFMYEPAR